MQGGRGRGDPFFGFGGMPSLFGGRDPFFMHPHGRMSQHPTPFGPSFFGPIGSPFMDAPRIHEHRQSLPRGPVIEELNSDDENEQPKAVHGIKKHHHKHGREVMHDTRSRPQAHSYSFQSSSVTYAGSNGAYYASSTTRRAGSDGVRFEEHKEADSVTGEAAHRVSRGIHNKGHTVSRHLKSDGHVDTMQTLHNLNEDEVSGFEEAWNYTHHGGVEGSGGWALPSTQHAQSSKVWRR